MSEKTTFHTILEHFKDRVKFIKIGEGNLADIVAARDDITLHSLKPFIDERRTAPERRVGTASFEDLGSFIAHAQRFADADSALYATATPATAPKLVSVLDYHRAGADGDPRFGKHRGVYSFPVSDEWASWTRVHGKALSQTEFAEWIENRVFDIADPSTATNRALQFKATVGCEFASLTKLVELSRGLAIRVGSKVKNVVNLATGEAQVQYITEHADESGAPLKVPGAFLLALPVFRGGDSYQIPVRLRYRHKDGSITWMFELYRTDATFEDAFRGACKLAAEQTTLPLFLGTPEA